MTIDTAKLLRERLRSLRESRNLSQKEVEDRIGKEANYITRVETGRIDWPPSEVIDRICEVLGVSPSDLFFAEGFDDNPEVLRQKIQNLLTKASAVGAGLKEQQFRRFGEQHEQQPPSAGTR